MGNPKLKLLDTAVAKDINETINHLRTFTDKIILPENHYKTPSNENEMAQKVKKKVHQSVIIESHYKDHYSQGTIINILFFTIFIFLILIALLNSKWNYFVKKTKKIAGFK